MRDACVLVHYPLGCGAPPGTAVCEENCSLAVDAFYWGR
jgi:hypothetical protein